MPRWWIGAVQFSFGLAFKGLNAISRLTLGLVFFKIEAKGAERLKNLRGPLIVAPNHKTFVDFCFVIAAMPLNNHLVPARTIGADWLFRTSDNKEEPLLRRLAKKVGVFFSRCLARSIGADPARKGAGLEISLHNLLVELEKGHVVYIHSEGGIRYKPGIFPVKRGAAYLARETGAPVLPIAIRGVEYFTPWSFFFGRREVTISFGKPLYIEPSKSLEEASLDIWQAIKNLYAEPPKN